MAFFEFANNAVSTLAADIVAGDGTITVQAGHGSRFPAATGSNSFMVTIQEGAVYEIVECVSRTGDVLTVVRGQESTSAQNFTAGASVTNRITAGALARFYQRIDDAFSQLISITKANLQNAALRGMTGALARWDIVLGNDDNEAGANAGSNLEIKRYNDAGSILGHPVRINRASGEIQLEGPLRIDYANPVFTLERGAAGEIARLQGRIGASMRWSINPGDTTAEGGANAGSNFTIESYNDAGTLLHTPLSIARATGVATLSRGLVVNNSIVVSDQGYRAGTGGVGFVNVKQGVDAATPGFMQVFTGDGSERGFVGSKHPSVNRWLLTGQNSWEIEVYQTRLFVSNDLILFRHAAPTTGVLYMRQDQSQYLFFDGSEFQFSDANLRVGNAGTHAVFARNVAFSAGSFLVSGGSITRQREHNVGGVSYAGTGRYGVSFANAAPHAEYMVLLTVSATTDTNAFVPWYVNRTVNGFAIGVTDNSSDAPFDPTGMSFMVILGGP